MKTKEELIAMGADGLYSTHGPCGCGLDDLAPCGEQCEECMPARVMTAERARAEGFQIDSIYDPVDLIYVEMDLTKEGDR